MKPNQGGGAPMDIENECEVATRAPIVTTTTITKSPANISSLTKELTETEKLNSTTASALTDPNLFLNGFPTGYMFFPASSTTPASAATATVLMDPTTTAMMAAAMQQMQQTYTGYGLSTDVSGGTTPAVNGATATAGGPLKEMIKTKHCILFPPNPDAPPPTIRERPPGCRTVFVGGLPENVTEEIIREIFESCGEITTLRMSKKNFCHIRYRTEASIDHAIYLSGYRLRIADASDPMNYGRLHVDYAQARDDQYDYECKQRQQLREQRHRERMALDRSESPPPIPHYTDHEASLVSEHLRNNETFLKSVQTITVWLERGDCTKRNANAFYSMIQSTHAHVRRLYSDKQILEQDLRKARESYRKQMLTMSTQFTQIEKVFSAASHKKVWDHFTKAQRKNIDQWKKLASELRSVQIEDDEMEMSDDDRDSRCSSTKKARYDSDSLKEENDSLRCQIDAMRNEMFLNRSEIRQDSDFREKQIKVLQETIRNMQTQLLQTKMREQKDAKCIEQLERELKEARIRALLLQTQLKEAKSKQKEFKANSSSNPSSIANEESIPNSIDEKLPHENNEEEETDENNRIFIETDKTEENENNITQMQIKVDEAKQDLLIATENNSVDLDDADDDDDDVHFISVQKKKTFNFNSVSIQRSNFCLDDNDVVVLEEEEEGEEKDKCKDDQSKDVSNELDEIKKQEIHTNSKIVPELETMEEFKSLEHYEARIIALVAAYLVVQPFGANSSTICCYLCNFLKSTQVQVKSLNEILRKYENLFETIEQKISSDTCNNQNEDELLELKWKFCGFTETKTSQVLEA